MSTCSPPAVPSQSVGTRRSFGKSPGGTWGRYSPWRPADDAFSSYSSSAVLMSSSAQIPASRQEEGGRDSLSTTRNKQHQQQAVLCSSRSGTPAPARLSCSVTAAEVTPPPRHHHWITNAKLSDYPLASQQPNSGLVDGSDVSTEALAFLRKAATAEEAAASSPFTYVIKMRQRCERRETLFFFCMWKQPAFGGEVGRAAADWPEVGLPLWHRQPIGTELFWRHSNWACAHD